MVIVLEEKLHPATKAQFKLLQQQIETNPETAKMLTTPMKQIPQYHNIFRRELQIPLLQDSTLLQALIALSTYSSITLEFSKSGNIFTGFLAYKENGSEITSMKIASFKEDKKQSNLVLAADLLLFLEKEITKRTKVEWLADKGNITAVKQYDKFLNDKNYIWIKEENKNEDMWVYTITRKR